MEPQLATEDIQGHVFPGFGATHSVVIVLNIREPAQARAALAKLPRVTSMAEALHDKSERREAAVRGIDRPAQSSVSFAVSLAASALRSWNVRTSALDASFDAGMLDDAIALGDPTGDAGIPSDWMFNNSASTRADVLLVGAHSEEAVLHREAERWISLLRPSLEPVLVEYGRRRAHDKEFFGFNDGVSQPALRGVDHNGEPLSRRTIAPQDPRSQLFAKPGQLLVWPGLVVFGYAGQTSDVTVPGPEMQPPTSWLRNGSYLVFRRLRQDVAAFRSAVGDLQSQLINAGEHVSEAWVGSRLVGRWPDGTPVTASPHGPDSEISDSLRVNNFRFASRLSPTPLWVNPPLELPAVSSDLLGRACPRVAHIRKVNPRDGMSEIGAEHHAEKLILRRGVTFGPEEEDAPEAQRGLLFLSYQTSIVNQFKFLQMNWSNSATRPTGDGIDPVIGQDGTDHPKRFLKLFGPSGQSRHCRFDGRWVVPTGGEYFVTLGIAGLKWVLDG